VDLFFLREFGSADIRSDLDYLCEASGLPERPVFHVRGQVSAGEFSRILSVGLANIFIRCGLVALPVIIETMTRRN
jgi:hypothetical protein